MTWRAGDDLGERFAALVPEGADRVQVAEATYAALATRVPFDFACFATTDPATGVVTWASKTRSLGVGDEAFATVEYGPPDVNKLVDVARRDPPVAPLWLDTGGRPDDCRRFRELMSPVFGFTDELRVAFTSRGACWAVLGAYRSGDAPPFSAADVEAVAAMVAPVAAATQRSLFAEAPNAVTPGAADAAGPVGPAVLVVGSDDRPVHQTPAARTVVEDLGGLDHGSLPASLLHAVTSSRTRSGPFETRTQGLGGSWWELRAVPLEQESAARPDVVLSIEPTPREALRRLALVAHGLTTREEEVAVLVLEGHDTRGIAAALFLSPHTVQDHLKTVFAKVGVRSRRELVARLG